MSLSIPAGGILTWYTHSGMQFGNNYDDVKYLYKFDNNSKSKNVSHRHVHSNTKDTHTRCLL